MGIWAPFDKITKLPPNQVVQALRSALIQPHLDAQDPHPAYGTWLHVLDSALTSIGLRTNTNESNIANLTARVAALEARPVDQASRIYVGSNAYDPDLIGKVKAGDFFIYNDGGDHPGWMYQRNADNTDWNYAVNLKG